MRFLTKLAYFGISVAIALGAGMILGVAMNKVLDLVARF